MEELYQALELRRKYNKMKLEDFIKEFETFTNQKIPKEAIDNFRFTGLNNIDMITSNYLWDYKLNNLYDHILLK